MNTALKTYTEKVNSHDRHQAMLREHAEAKLTRRERHKKHWHRISVIPIQLV